MLNTPPPPPPKERDTATLVEDLCVALRNVGVFDYELPAGERVAGAVDAVRVIHQELQGRGIDVAERLRELSLQTRWRMEDLLQDCLTFPATTPYVREADGIRRRLRCNLCLRAERPPDADALPFCGDCLARVVDSIDRRTPIDGVALFRTYNPECRCDHADSETVLALLGWGDTLFGNCRQCITAELRRRGAGVDG